MIKHDYKPDNKVNRMTGWIFVGYIFFVAVCYVWMFKFIQELTT